MGEWNKPHSWGVVVKSYKACLSSGNQDGFRQIKLCPPYGLRGIWEVSLMMSQWLPSQSVSSTLGCPAQKSSLWGGWEYLGSCLLGLQKPEHLEATSLHSFQLRC